LQVKQSIVNLLSLELAGDINDLFSLAIGEETDSLNF
jgi:hypothetical protein